ncbi:hypothetical protein ANCCEY_13673 [Ancylostoma ceylanicum]|uniref:Uncharacterized protein n=1 Tax=Ancylostoma ceylanicum TaxID=53326 RepID=A0A0D6L883_9BILA|nr:hypothetical protein ANCCEY_13673 [Ancylostoma ceylanicum]
MDPPKLDHSTITIRTVDGSAMNIFGSFKAAFTIFDRKGPLTERTGCCFVMESVELLKLECLELGRSTKTKARLFLKPGARPVYREKRSVPFASQAAVNAEIEREIE